MMMTSSIQKLWLFRRLVLLLFLQIKETAVIVKRIDQLPQNLARMHNLGGSFDKSHKKVKCFILRIVSIVFYFFSVVRLLFQH